MGREDRVRLSSGRWVFFFFQAEDGIRDRDVTGVQTCALPIFGGAHRRVMPGQIKRKREPQTSGLTFVRWLMQSATKSRSASRVGQRSVTHRPDRERAADYASGRCHEAPAPIT